MNEQENNKTGNKPLIHTIGGMQFPLVILFYSLKNRYVGSIL